MSLQVTATNTHINATLSGTLDGEAARQLSSQVRAAGFPGAHVQLHLSGVTSVATEGLTQLMSLKRWAVREGGKLNLVSPSSEVMDALRMNELDREFSPPPGSATGPVTWGDTPPLPFEAPPSFAPQPGDEPPSFGTPAPAYSPQPMSAASFDPPPFDPPPPVAQPRPAEPARRREEASEEPDAWTRQPAAADRAVPAAAAAFQAPAAAGPKKKSRAGLWAALLLVAAGGGAAAWYFWLNKKPEVLTPAATWTLGEELDANFEIRFKNAARLEVTLPPELEDLALGQEVLAAGEETKMQVISGNTTATGTHTLTAVAVAEGGAKSPAITYTLNVTAREVVSTAGSKPLTCQAGTPLKDGAIELARSCATATATGLDGTGLSVKVDPATRVATLTGTPEKKGEVKFTLSAANRDGKEKQFSLMLKVLPSDAELIAAAKKIAEEEAEKRKPPEIVNNGGQPVDNVPETPKLEPDKPNDKPAVEPGGIRPVTPEEEIAALRAQDPKSVTLLRDRIWRADPGRFDQKTKDRMIDSLKSVRSAEVLAKVHFENKEESINDVERRKLEQTISSLPKEALGTAGEKRDIVVVGYASKKGGSAMNIRISKARAASVDTVLRAMNIRPVFTGDYGATDFHGGDDAANRVVEIHAFTIDSQARRDLDQLVDYMKQMSGSRR